MSRKSLKRAVIIGGFLISIVAGVSFAAKKEEQKLNQPIYGRYEVVTIEELDRVPIKAKLDTGAYTASLHAIDIEYFEKDGDDWVRFIPVIENETLEVREMPLLKISRIKQRAEEGDDSDDIASAQRPVVEMSLCIGNKREVIEVNLTNRGHFTYPLLLGAKSLRQLKALVDPARKYTADPDC